MAHTSPKPLNYRELSVFCSQMALMLSAGISAMEAVSILREGLEDPGAQAILGQVSDSLEAGESLFAALSAPEGAFPRYFLDMTDTGERAGQLDVVFSSLAAYYDRRDALSRNIRSAVAYPLVMVAMMLAVILVLVIQVMPIFRQVYAQLGTEMNRFSAGVLDLGAWLSRYSLAFLILACALVLALLWLTKTASGKRRLAVLSRRLPGIRQITRATALSRFADGMAITLRSGLDTDESLELAGRVTESPQLRDKIEACRQQASQGTDLGTAFRENGLFSGLAGKMVSVGILSGSLDTVLAQVAEQYAEEASQRINRAVARLEPTLVALLSVLVGIILLSVMLPLMGIMSNIG